MEHANLTELEIQRRKNLQSIIEMGIEPFPAEEFTVSNHAEQILEEFSEEANNFKDITIAGRLMQKRIMGKASFAEIQDSTGRIQVYINRDELCPEEDKSLYNDLFKKYMDIGDFVGFHGKVFKTQTGHTSLHADSMTFLSKSIRPLPIVKTDAEGNVHDAFSDVEMRYRQRYVDLVVNKGVKETFVLRAKIFQAMRNFFLDKGYLEVDTPVLQSIPGGAAARPFITHHNALDIPLYLRIANELYLKRLIVGGFEGVFEFSRNFRNEGIDRTHNPEFTAMEIYIAYKDYNWMMNFTESMLSHIVQSVHGKTEIEFDSQMIQYAGPYERISMYDVIKKYTGTDISKMNEEDLKAFCKSQGVSVDNTMGRGKLIDELFGEKCEKHLIQPTFIIDYPIEMSPLCKKHRTDPQLTERFELFINGKEIANAYSELNDPIDQLERFQEQLKLAEKGDDEAMMIDMDFVRSLEYGMPPTSGLGIGMDRLCMFLTNNKTIQEVLLFPQMRPEKQS
jgi:lysyl-tRNA synthetase class 2